MAPQMPAEVARAMPFRRVDVDAGGSRMSIVDDGPRDAASTVLFLHGNPMWSYLWRKLIPPALEAGHRVVAPDHVGCGLSDKPTDPAYYSLDRHVENLVEVARALDLRDLTLVMHDWGGPIGMGFAVREPQRIRSLVVANTTAFAPKKQRAFSHFHRVMGHPLGYRAGVALNLVGHIALRYAVARPLPPEVRRAYEWPLREKGARVCAGRWAQMVPDGPDHAEAPAFRAIEEGLPKLSHAPVHVLWADKDPVMRPWLAERWRKTPLNVVKVEHVAPDASHFWQEDAPEKFVPGILEAARA